MGRLEAHRLGLGSQGQLGLRLSRPARANGLAGHAVWLGLIPPRAWFLPLRGLAAHSSSSPRWAGLLPSPPRWAGCACSSPPLTVCLGPGVSVRGIRCGGPDPVQQTRVRVCVCVAPEGACGVSAQGVLGERPQRPGRDANATSRSCRGVDAHGETVARLGVLRMSAAVALRCGCARTRAEPGCPGPRRGRAVRGAPASRARGTTRRR
jgi:hypothetical protein